jgi:RecJ-like exonuclease
MIDECPDCNGYGYDRDTEDNCRRCDHTGRFYPVCLCCAGPTPGTKIVCQVCLDEDSKDAAIPDFDYQEVRNG